MGIDRFFVNNAGRKIVSKVSQAQGLDASYWRLPSQTTHSAISSRRTWKYILYDQEKKASDHNR